MAIIPASWLSNASMKRIILHWTGGGYKTNSIDKAAYHILIEDTGNLVRGSRSIKDNTSTSDGVFAMHISRLNTGSIGVSVCCMLGATSPRVSASNFVLFDTDKKYEALVFSKFLLKTGQFSTNN